MKKRIISALLLICMVLGVVAMTGCQGGGNKVLAGNFAIPEGGYDGSEVTIKFYHTMNTNLQAVLDRAIAEFNKLYPNIHVEHEAVGGYDDVRDQVKTELTVGNQPNIAYCYPDHVALYNMARGVVTLDDLIASDLEVTRADGTTEILGLTEEQIADFIEGYYTEGAQFGDGLMYTLPMSKSTEVLYYNKTFFDANGLTPPTTWDEMETLCQKIKEIDPNCIPLGYDSEANWFITMTEQYGNDYTTASGDNHFLFDNDANKAFVKEFREWYQAGYLTTQEIYGNYTSGLFVAETGTKSYMSIGSSAGATHQSPILQGKSVVFEVGITSIPQVDPANPKVISQGPSLCIFKDANPQEVIASWLLVKYLTTNVAFQAEFSMASGYVPVIKSVAEDEVYKEFMNNGDGYELVAAQSAKVCLEQVDAYYTSPAFNGSSTARDQVGLLMQSAFVNDDGGDLDAMLNALFQKAIDECNR